MLNLWNAFNCIVLLNINTLLIWIRLVTYLFFDFVLLDLAPVFFPKNTFSREENNKLMKVLNAPGFVFQNLNFWKVYANITWYIIGAEQRIFITILNSVDNTNTY